MSDSDLEAIRQARLQQLQSQQSSAPSGGGGNASQEDQQKYPSHFHPISSEHLTNLVLFSLILEPLPPSKKPPFSVKSWNPSLQIG